MPMRLNGEFDMVGECPMDVGSLFSFLSIIIEGLWKIKFSEGSSNVPLFDEMVRCSREAHTPPSSCYFKHMTKNLDNAEKPFIVMKKNKTNDFLLAFVIFLS